MDNSVHSYKDAETALQRYLPVFETAFEASGDDIEELSESNLKLKKSKNIREIINKRMMLIENDKNKDKTYMTPRDQENMQFYRSLEPEYHKSKKTLNDDQTLGDGEVLPESVWQQQTACNPSHSHVEKKSHSQSLIFLPDESALGKYKESPKEIKKSSKIKADSRGVARSPQQDIGELIVTH